MLNNFRNLHSLLGSHGSRWLLFRVAYALRKQTGYIRMQMPQYRWDERPLRTWLKKNVPSMPDAYAAWRTQNAPRFLFRSLHLPKDIPWNTQASVEEAERILSGELKYFSHAYHPIGFPPDWHKDPVTGVELESQKHWSELSDDAEVDIKFIWEASRFGMIYPLVRAHASTRDERYAQAFWQLIQSWAETNPPNTGPNWMDGQEAALRLLAWMFGYYQFFDSPFTTPQQIAQFTVLVAAHAERIYKNIDYAISTHSNHAVSEAFGLWLVGLLFPELRDSEKYLALGRRRLEQEAAAQIFPDGTYSMYSLNYHRFVLHLYLCVIQLAELNPSPVFARHPLGSSLIADRVSASIDYLAQLIDSKTGKMPVYGSNDGALVLPLNHCDFTDYRPLLQLGSYVIRKQLLFEPGPWDEDLFWLCGDQITARNSTDATKSQKSADLRGRGGNSFPHGGTYLLRGPDSQAVMRCTNYRSRPSHADQLHVDLWMRGMNIACDAGTYLYSGEGVWRNGLAHTAVHNTVTVDHLDQMKMLTRFTWTQWSYGNVLQHDMHIWQGEHDGYKRLENPVNHKRTVISLGEDRWLIVDHLTATQPHHYALHWLLTDGQYGVQQAAPGNRLWLEPADAKVSDSKIIIQTRLLEGRETFSIVRADPTSTRGWRSQYYGDKEPAISILLETNQSSACFWTYFGLDEDSLTLVGTILRIGFENTETETDLNQLNK